MTASPLLNITAKDLREGWRDAWAHAMDERRRAANLTQAKMAELVFGLDEAGKVRGRDKVSAWARGAQLPSTERRAALAVLLDWDTESMLREWIKEPTVATPRMKASQWARGFAEGAKMAAIEIERLRALLAALGGGNEGPT